MHGRLYIVTGTTLYSYGSDYYSPYKNQGNMNNEDNWVEVIKDKDIHIFIATGNASQYISITSRKVTLKEFLAKANPILDGEVKQVVSYASDNATSPIVVGKMSDNLFEFKYYIVRGGDYTAYGTFIVQKTAAGNYVPIDQSRITNGVPGYVDGASMSFGYQILDGNLLFKVTLNNQNTMAFVRLYDFKKL